MARHRNIRSMKYEDEYDFDDAYGQSVEDDYCVSPATAAQFTFDRSRSEQLFSYVGQEELIPEEEEYEKEDSSLHDSLSSQRPRLSATDEAKLNSCLEEMGNILGETTPELTMVDAVLKSNFNFDVALNSILSAQEAPKPQRAPREKRNRGTKGSSRVDNKKSEDVVTSAAQQMTFSGEPLPDVARMTFASGNKKDSGFSPIKDVKTSETDRTCVISDKNDLDKSETSNKSQGAIGKEQTKETDSVTSTETEALTPKKDQQGSVVATPIHKSASKIKLEKLDRQAEYEKRKADGKDFINLVVIGHVDAGKSTLMGHVLFQLGFVNKRTMHKYEQESKKLGKASFAFAWVLDETEEERARGVTMDIAQTRFETPSKIVTLLDAPGHKDFIPNMITGAAQADVAVLVVNATRGEFETGFETGGQTREHAMLIRSLGVSQLLVAINKMDTVNWSETRYNEITGKLRTFLKQAGFREADIKFAPCSGLNGQNLAKPPTEEKLVSWFKGMTLVEGIDQFRPPERLIDKPFRLCVGDIFKGMGTGFSVAGTIQTGSLQAGDRVLVMPQGDMAVVKGIHIDEGPVQIAFAGDSAVVTITGSDINNIGVGSILCDPLEPIKASSRFRARVVVFNIDTPITKGFPVVLHYQSLCEPAHIKRLVSQLHKSTGEVIKKNPRCLTKNSSAIVELALERPICLELYKDFKDLGRITLRYLGKTIAAGLVTEVLEKKTSKSES